MRDAQYLRAQAEICLEVASQVSNQRTVENLKAEAARYHAEPLILKLRLNSSTKWNGISKTEHSHRKPEKNYDQRNRVHPTKQRTRNSGSQSWYELGA